MKHILHFFDKLEDKVRAHLSRAPILYAIIGGISIAMFWRGVWESADYLNKHGTGWLHFVTDPFVSMLLSILVLLVTGLFVSFFIGDRIILSGLRREKKIEEKTESEVREEEVILTVLQKKLERLQGDIDEVKTLLKDK